MSLCWFSLVPRSYEANGLAKYTSVTAFSVSYSSLNSEPLSDVMVLNSDGICAPARSTSDATACVTGRAALLSIFRMTSNRVCRSASVSSTASCLCLAPMTVSISQWPNVSRVFTASGRSEMDGPSFRL